jgi:DNA repair protein RadC
VAGHPSLQWDFRLSSFKITPVYRCQLVHEGSTKTSPKLSGSSAAAAVAVQLLKDSPSEQFVSIMLDTKLNVIGVHVVTTGTFDASLVHPREAFRAAIIANASAVIFAHNHPSGDCTPSREDMGVLDQLERAGKHLGISVHDSIVVNSDGDWTSCMQLRASSR